jgi:isoquinoline 1-oxidoreductase beta subunit
MLPFCGWQPRRPVGAEHCRRGKGAASRITNRSTIASPWSPKVSAAQSALKVDRIVAAVDCGVAINPDVVTAQIEGAMGLALSSALRNQVTLNKGVVEQRNFDDYEPTRMREMPKVEVHLVESTAAPSGIGEPGVPPIAPAIGNAIFAATGMRPPSLPFDLKTLV